MIVPVDPLSLVGKSATSGLKRTAQPPGLAVGRASQITTRRGTPFIEFMNL